MMLWVNDSYTVTVAPGRGLVKPVSNPCRPVGLENMALMVCVE